MPSTKYNKKTKSFNDGSEFAMFLEGQASKHNHFHHYTSMRCLEMILKNRTIKLTRGNSKSLNDWHEAEVKGDPFYWNKTYIGCFSFDDNNDSDINNYDSENMAMWGIYGLPSNEAIRFSLNKDIMFSFIDNYKKIIDKINHKEVLLTDNNDDSDTDFIFLDGDKQNKIETKDIDFIGLTDVFYVKGTNNDIVSVKQNHYSLPINFELEDSADLHKFLQNWNFTGYVKNNTWSYEKETRIILRLKGIKEKENLFMEIPEKVINSFQITLGPSFYKSLLDKSGDDVILEVIKDNLSKFGINKNNVRRSLFAGQINYKK